MERLQKYLASCGVGSRRKCEEYIAAGRVSVNGTVVTELGTKVEEGHDKVAFDGREIIGQEKLVTVMLNKPEGYVTTSHDQFNRPCVTDLVADIPERIYPVGRLDYQTTGLLIMTNDGDLAYGLTHPKKKISKTYQALLKGNITSEALQDLEKGVVLDDGYRTKKSKVKLLGMTGNASRVEITIYEGKTHQVRRMARAVHFPVLRLKRVEEAGLVLGELEEGKYRILEKKELDALKALIKG